jgi:serine/threonine protein kinase
MTISVEHFCNVLSRTGLLGPDQVRDLRQRWMESAGAEAPDGEKFLTWLAAAGTITEYQAGVVARGHAAQLFLGPYTLQERVGKGRMAGVWRALHPTTGQVVAIKVLPPSKAKDPQLLGRFQRESRLAVRLQHPNIVRTFQTGEANGLHYLVMEHLEGEELDRVLQRRRMLPPGEAVRLVHQALLGLQHVHEQGLVHRDLKPGNLMLVGGRPDSTLDATVKILDIGTGRALFDDGPVVELTNSADLLGTPQYMAPEQARDPHGADIRADIYSLGCVLYHALTGRPPFNDSNPVRLLVRQATEDPRPIQELNPAVPDGFQQILTGMLSKDPARRFPTPGRAAQALETFLATGAAVVPLEKDPQMGAYLNWLAVEQVAATPGVPIVEVEAEFLIESATVEKAVVEVEAVFEESAVQARARPPRRSGAKGDDRKKKAGPGRST